MIKNLLAVFVVVNIALGSPVPSSTSTEAPGPFSLENFLNSLPTDKIKELVQKHLADDPGFVSAVKYLKSPEWAEIRQKMRDSPKWIALKDHFKQFGIDIEVLVGRMDHCLNTTEIEKLPDKGAPANLTSFIADLKAHIMVPAMKSANDMIKKAGGEDGMKKFLEKIGGPDTKKLLEEALDAAEVKAFLKKLKEMGMPIEEQLVFVYVLFGWEPKKIEF